MVQIRIIDFAFKYYFIMMETDYQLRNQLNIWLEAIAIKLNLRDKEILEIGIAGDEKPSGSYKFFGEGNKWITLDKNSKWEPDIVADITNNNIPDSSYDLIIMTQTLEHIWDYKKALSELYRISKKYAIVDCPFIYSFHQDAIRKTSPWWEWDDYWRFTPTAFRKLLQETGFKEVEINFNKQNTIALCQK